jgi:hypothetical protein
MEQTNEIEKKKSLNRFGSGGTEKHENGPLVFPSCQRQPIGIAADVSYLLMLLHSNFPKHLRK